MDIGNWLFVGMVVISGIASVSKAIKKKAASQASGEQTSTHQDKSDAMDEWIKRFTKGFLDEDDFIPKNESQPTVKHPVQPTSRETAQPYANAEEYRRNNQSLEVSSRPRVSLENITVVEGKVSHTGLHGSAKTLQSDPVDENPLLNPTDDFSDMDEVRKAIIYGEIIRTKF